MSFPSLSKKWFSRHSGSLHRQKPRHADPKGLRSVSSLDPCWLPWCPLILGWFLHVLEDSGLPPLVFHLKEMLGTLARSGPQPPQPHHGSRRRSPERGETMRIASSEFADDPCSSVKRGTMVRAARALLSAVTRLLILADMADVMRLLSHLKIVEEALEAVKNATNEQDLANRFKEFGKEMVKLNYVAARRQQELKDPHCRDEMAAARGALKKNATMLYTASQAFLRHPDVAATRANRDYVFKQVQEAIAGISNAAQATSPTDEAKGHTGIGELAAALNEFDVVKIVAQCMVTYFLALFFCLCEELM
uniref:Catenin alpha-2 n=1 Tax=Felis catus TaxID=9685 RepID=A0ABI7VZS1_FELCA